jgi:ABC-type iron transport system FetAB permease component
MLAGSSISGVAVAVNYITKEIVVNRDTLETLLAHGASRSEACIPLAREALTLALLPAINQMSVYVLSLLGDDHGTELADFKFSLL